MKILNLDMMKHPSNWFTLTLMVLISGVVLELIVSHFSNRGTTTQ